MNTAITTTLISVLGAGLFGMFFVLFKNLSDLVANGFAAVEARFGRLEERFGRLEDKVDGLVGEVHALEIKFTSEIRAHGERLARIEAKLEPDPPAEAA